MDPLEKVKKALEAAGKEIVSTATLDSLPPCFYDAFILKGLRIDAIEHGRVLCSMTVPPRLLNTGDFLHGGATASLVDIVGSATFYSVGVVSSGVSLEISISYLDSAFVNFPLMLKSKKLHLLIAQREQKQENGGEEDDEEIREEELHRITLLDFSGGAETFEVGDKFCYGVKV